MKGSGSAIPQLIPLNMTIKEASERLTSYINGLDREEKEKVELLDGFNIDEFIDEYQKSGHDEKWIVQSLNGFLHNVEHSVNKNIRKKTFSDYLQSLTKDERAIISEIRDIDRAKQIVAIYQKWCSLGYTIISLLKQFNDLPSFWRPFIIGRLTKDCRFTDETEFLRYCGTVRTWSTESKHLEFLIEFDNVLKEINGGGRGSRP